MTMNRKLNFIAALLVLMVTLPVVAQLKTVKVTSPDLAIVFSLSIHGHQAEYTISRNGKPVIDPSFLGLTINDQKIGEGTAVTEVSHKSVDETYKTCGVHSIAVDRYNEMLFGINSNSPYQIDVKVFNDGVAFRYVVANKGEAKVNADLTAFTIPLGSTIWSQNDINSYEAKYQEQ